MALAIVVEKSLMQEGELQPLSNIKLKEKKGLLINYIYTFMKKVYVTIETIKNKIRQLVLAFSFDLVKWLTFQALWDEMQEAKCHLQFSGPNRK